MITLLTYIQNSTLNLVNAMIDEAGRSDLNPTLVLFQSMYNTEIIIPLSQLLVRIHMIFNM